MNTFYKINEDGTVSIGSGTGIPEGFIKYIKGNEQKELLDILSRDKAQKRVKDTQLALQSLCDTKSIAAKAYINGAKVTVEQLARYEEKYQIAIEYKANGNYADILKLEADLQGLTVGALADVIITKGDAYKQALITFNAKIEAFRVQVSKLINAGDIDKANAVIEQAKAFNETTTDAQIIELFNA